MLGVYLSILLRPNETTHTDIITTQAAVAVCEAIEAVCDKNPGIKWVNDVYLNDKKICGILTEAVTDIESGSIEWMVVGIGVNFTAPAEGFPAELANKAGALFAREATTSRNRFIAEIIKGMIKPTASRGQMLTAYKSRLMMLGKKIKVMNAQESYSATALDIDQNARLIVQKQDGTVVTVSSGEVSLLL